MASRSTLLVFLVHLMTLAACTQDEDIAYSLENNQILKVGVARPQEREKRYILYSVNPVEGFNLKRDVYMRVANIVKILREKDNWILVLPPWGRSQHWKTDKGLKHLPWRTFFDVESLNRYVPVIEFEDYLKEIEKNEIEEIIRLQKYKEGWKSGEWEEKVDERECISRPSYVKDSDGRYRGSFWGHEEVYALKFHCMSVQGFSTILKTVIENTSSKSILFERFEEVLHVHFGGIEYWNVRRSMVFAKHLRDEGDKFRRETLNSTDVQDHTSMDDDWMKNTKMHGDAKGGEYLAVHLRRGDFLWSHKSKVPSLDGAIQQIKKILKKLHLQKVFLATDAQLSDIKYIKKRLDVTTFVPSKEFQQKSHGDGSLAIIDQWICAHAKYFVGSCLSTFSFRINDEREILGFDPDSTYNCLCPDNEVDKCEQPSRWTIVYR